MLTLNEMLTDLWMPTGSPQTMPAKATQHQNANNAFNASLPIHWHNLHPAWIEEHHLHTNTCLSWTDCLSSRQGVPAIPCVSSNSLTYEANFEGFCHANRKSWYRNTLRYFLCGQLLDIYSGPLPVANFTVLATKILHVLLVWVVLSTLV